MKRKGFMLMAISLGCAAATLAYTTRTQTDWIGGPGMLGPVTTWSTAFSSSTATDFGNAGYLVLARQPQFPGTQHHIGTRTELYQVQTGDIDGDGRADCVVGGHTSGIVWYRNLGNGQFQTTPTMILDYTWPSFEVVDLNENGLADIVYTNDQYIYWYENLDGGRGMWQNHQISPYFNEVDGTGTIDFDRDGDLDIVAGGVQVTDLRWYRNDGNENFTQYIITTNYQGPNNAAISVGDLDGDNYPDFVIPSEFGNFLDWWENSGANPPTFSRHTLLTGYNGTRNAFIADVNMDGRKDILSVAIGSDSVDWWENNGANPPTFTRHNLANNYNGAYDIAGFDADRDGDTDIFTTAQNGDTLDWWQNSGGTSPTFTRGIVANNYNGASGIWVDYADNDNVLDIFSTALDGNSVDWWAMTYGYRSNGELFSSILNTAGSPAWGHINWNATAPAGTSVGFQVRASANSSNMGSWSSTITTNGASLQNYIANGLRYFQYRALLSTTNSANTPRLNDVRITYSTVTGIAMDFHALSKKDGVELVWRAEEMTPLSGFNLYRAPVASDGRREQINATLITGESPYSYVDDVAAGPSYNYWLEAVPLQGPAETLGPVQGRAGGSLVKTYALYDSYPNPSRGQVTFAFALPENADVTLEVYDLAGRCVATPAKGVFKAGENAVTWSLASNGQPLPAGVYIYSFRAGTYAATKRLVIAE